MKPSDFPLVWPVGHDRTSPEARVVGRFKIRFDAAYDQLVAEAEKLHDDSDQDVIISTNLPLDGGGLPLVVASGKDKIADPGVCLYVRRGGLLFGIPCDHYREVRHNLRALWATVAAYRTIWRHGGSPLLLQAMSGFRAKEIAAPPSDALLEELRPVKRLAGVRG